MTGVTDILVGASNPKTLHPDVGNMTAIHNLKKKMFTSICL
jgi:hypothetical protein